MTPGDSQEARIGCGLPHLLSSSQGAILKDIAISGRVLCPGMTKLNSTTEEQMKSSLNGTESGRFSQEEVNAIVALVRALESAQSPSDRRKLLREGLERHWLVLCGGSE
jgi:hypothetical protein